VTEAKRHHWIPRTILREFSTAPAANNPKVVRLEKKTGKTEIRAISNEAVIGQFNTIETEMTGPYTSVESGSAAIEGRCKPALNKALAGEDLSPEDFQHLVVFALLQYRRTPRMRQAYVELIEPIAQVHAQIGVGKVPAEKIREWLQTRQETAVTHEQVEAYRSEILDNLRDEKLMVRASADHEVLSPFVGTSEAAWELSQQMSLTVWLATSGTEFIIGDHPVSIIDPSIPWDRGIGWITSPNTRAALPISRTVCLEFRPGPPGFGYRDASLDRVRDINLRSYAQSEWAIWGSAARWVQETRATAKADKQRTASYAPRKGHLFFLERMEGAAAPHAVTVHQPKENPVRGFIRTRKRKGP
jgi:hypothetical protein